MEKIKYEIKSNEKLGRYVIAKLDIRPGEVIIKEYPVAIGPKARCGMVCLDCLRPLLNKFDTCNKCKIATLCKDGCIENFNSYHNNDECNMFKNLSNSLTVPMVIGNFDAITPLRCLLLKRKVDQRAWSAFIQLESHIESRKKEQIWNFNENINKFIRSQSLLTEDEIEEDLIQKICGIIDVNCFELRSPTVAPNIPRSDAIRGVYVTAALMSHNCTANTHIAIGDDYEMTVRASVAIRKGDVVSFNYTNPLQGTLQRQQHLMEGKYFRCDCSRCLDSTELGLYVSSILCSICKAGYVSILTPQSETYYKATDIWRCEQCSHDYKGSMVLETVMQIKDRFEDRDKTNYREIEAFIALARKTLTSNHYVMIEAKQCLAGLLRDNINREINPSKSLMIKKYALCKELLPILEKVEPGISRLKAITLYEIHSSEAQLAHRDYEAKEISTEVFYGKLQQAEDYLKQALYSLLFEPKSSPEGMLCKRAMEELKILRTTILSTSASLNCRNLDL